MLSHYRPLRLAAIGASSLLLVACGATNHKPIGPLGDGPASTTLTPSQIAPPKLPSVDGYLLSASTDKLVVRTAAGELTFAVDPQDLPPQVIEHLQADAGTDAAAFRVYYTRDGGQRVAKEAREIPPPALDATP